MRFKEFLKEDKVINLSAYKNNISIMLDRKLLLLRKMRTDTENGLKIPFLNKNYSMNIVEYKGRDTPRSSLTGDNVFLSLSSKWEGFPDRRFSTFTTQDRKHTLDFSGSFGFVIPKDTVKSYGYSPEDFNKSTGSTILAKRKIAIEYAVRIIKNVIRRVCAIIEDEEGKENQSELRLALYDIISDHNINDILTKIYETNKFKAVADDLDKIADFCDALLRKNSKKYFTIDKKQTENTRYLHSRFVEDDLTDLIEYLEKNKVSTVKELFALVNPEYYKAKSFSSLQSIPVHDKASEVWFAGDYLFVNFSSSHYNKEELLNGMQALKDSIK